VPIPATLNCHFGFEEHEFCKGLVDGKKAKDASIRRIYDDSIVPTQNGSIAVCRIGIGETYEKKKDRRCVVCGHELLNGDVVVAKVSSKLAAMILTHLVPPTENAKTSNDITSNAKTSSETIDPKNQTKNNTTTTSIRINENNDNSNKTTVVNKNTSTSSTITTNSNNNTATTVKKVNPGPNPNLSNNTSKQQTKHNFNGSLGKANPKETKTINVFALSPDQVQMIKTSKNIEPNLKSTYKKSQYRK